MCVCVCNQSLYIRIASTSCATHKYLFGLFFPILHNRGFSSLLCAHKIAAVIIVKPLHACFVPSVQDLGLPYLFSPEHVSPFSQTWNSTSQTDAGRNSPWLKPDNNGKHDIMHNTLWVLKMTLSIWYVHTSLLGGWLRFQGISSICKVPALSPTASIICLPIGTKQYGIASAVLFALYFPSPPTAS